jgi:phosphate transport system permease protein
MDNRYRLRKRPQSEKLVDSGFKTLALSLASVVALILVAILIVVFQGGLPSMLRYGWEFLITSNWNPVDDEYGAGAAIYGTLVTSILSLFIAVPLGIGTAIFITENIIPEKLRNFIGLMVELLAAIPSVVLGLWAIFVMEPFIRPGLELLYNYFGWFPLFSSSPMGPGTLPAVLILVVMILPIITAITRDSLQQVPQQLTQAAYGIGTTRWGAIINVTVTCSNLWNCWWGDACPWKGNGRDDGSNDDYWKLKQLQLFLVGTWQYDFRNAGEPIWRS